MALILHKKKIEATIPITPSIVIMTPVPFYEVFIAIARPEKKNTIARK
jgi:hypothetical protein